MTRKDATEILQEIMIVLKNAKLYELWDLTAELHEWIQDLDLFPDQEGK